MAQKDLVVKMTINSKEFENGLQNSKKSMNDFDANIAKVTKSVGKFMLVVKAAQGALDVFKRIIGGTEQGADAMASAMYTAQSATRKFFQNLGDGEVSMRSFIDNLDTIRKNAQDAYEALDKLGTMKMWSNARMQQLRAEIAEQRVIVNSESSTAQQKEDAKNLIRLNTEKLTALSGDLAEQTTRAAQTKLREISGASDAISDELLKTFVKWFEEGTLGQKAETYRSQHAEYKTWQETVHSPGGWGAYTRTRGEWTFVSKQAEDMYNAMNSIAKAVESEGGLKDYYDLLSEEAAMRITVANQVNKANNAIKSGSGSSTSSTSSPGTRTPVDLIPGLPPLQTMDEGLVIMEKINARMQKQAEQEETNALLMTVGNMLYQQRIDELNSYATTLSQFSSMFAELTNLAADGSPWQRFGAAIGGVLGEISKLMSTYASLIAIESVAESIKAGNGIPFPYNLIAIAAAGTALLGIISSLKGSFQDAGSFATGGIVGGNSYTGDRLIAHVNSGEMILNRSQQMALFGRPSDDVHFIIEGSQLRGVLDNYDKTSNL